MITSQMQFVELAIVYKTQFHSIYVQYETQHIQPTYQNLWYQTFGWTWAAFPLILTFVQLVGLTLCHSQLGPKSHLGKQKKKKEKAKKRRLVLQS